MGRSRAFLVSSLVAQRIHTHGSALKYRTKGSEYVQYRIQCECWHSGEWYLITWVITWSFSAHVWRIVWRRERMALTPYFVTHRVYHKVALER
jgi:hypothetical protein